MAILSLRAGVAAAVFMFGTASPPSAYAGVIFQESGDAGDTLATAQPAASPTSQVLDAITGNLSSVFDLDYFGFFYAGGPLRIETGPYFNAQFPANTFPGFELFASDGTSRGGASQLASPVPFGNQAFVSAGSINYQPGTGTIDFAGFAAGEYFLRIDGAGQANTPQPRYVGDYSVRLIGGAQTLQTVPEPGTLALFGVALAGLVTWRRQKQWNAENIRRPRSGSAG